MPASSTRRAAGMPEKRRCRAAGVVRSRASSTSSPSASIAHSCVYLSPRSRPTVTSRSPMMVLASFMASLPMDLKSPSNEWGPKVPRGGWSSHPICTVQGSGRARCWAVLRRVGPWRGVSAATRRQVSGRHERLTEPVGRAGQTRGAISDSFATSGITESAPGVSAHTRGWSLAQEAFACPRRRRNSPCFPTLSSTV